MQNFLSLEEGIGCSCCCICNCFRISGEERAGDSKWSKIGHDLSLKLSDRFRMIHDVRLDTIISCIIFEFFHTNKLNKLVLLTEEF